MGHRFGSQAGRPTFFSTASLIALLAAPITAVNGESSTPAEAQNLQKQIVEALAAGRDAAPLLQQFRASSSATRPATSPLPNRSREAAELQLRLNEFERALAAAAQAGALSRESLRSLLVPYEALQAAHLLFEQRFLTVQEELARADLSPEAEARLGVAQQAYARNMAELVLALDPALGALQRAKDKEALLGDTAFRARSLAAIRQALALLAKHTSRRATPILRAGTLPYRQAKLAQRPPKLTPAILPSYHNQQETSVAPVPADTGATVDAPLTEEILQKAKDLGYDYIRIYEFVRNEIRTEWYAGAMKGAVGTLRQKSGNDIDQANLLIALFRASGLPSRYVHGVLELPIEDIANSLGLTDNSQATAMLTRAGIPYAPLIRGGRVAAVNVEHTWVSAFVPYTNYRGAVVDVSGKTWLPLMPALKQYDVTPSARTFAAAGLTADALIDGYLRDAQTGDLLGVIRKQVTDHLQASGSGADYAQQLGALSIAPKKIGLLPNTSPVSVSAVTGETAELTDAYRQRIRFVVRQGVRDADPIVLDYTVPVSEVASERVTLSYIPATVDDHKTVNLFGGLDYVPTYLIKLRPQLKVNGRAKAVGGDALDAGALNRFEIHLLSSFGTERVDQTITAGGYHAIGVYAQQVVRRIVEDDPADTEFTAARLLDRIAWTYSDRWNAAESELGGLLDVALVRPRPTLAVVGNSLRVDTVLGRAMQLTWQGVLIDAALRLSEPVARNGSAAIAKEWMRLSALQGSALEQQVFLDEFLVDAISADKGLRIARAAGTEVVRVTAANVGSLLPTLNHPPQVKADIESWVRLGMVVDVPRDPVSDNAWTGSVWRVEDPNSGAAGYFISGGLAGGQTTVDPDFWLLAWLRDALAAANTVEPNTDPRAGAYINVSGGDSQEGEVGTMLEQPLTVLVRDQKGRPVVGAVVTFAATAGGGQFSYEAVELVNGVPTSVTVNSPGPLQATTNYFGLATVNLELGKITSDSPIYVLRNASDGRASRAGLNITDASVETYGGSLALTKPFQAIGLPKPPKNLVRTNACCVGAPLPDSAHDVVNLQVQDEYGNPISNLDLTFTLTGSGDGSSGTLIGSCPGGCNGGSVTVPTDFFGANVTVMLGTALSYTLNASSPAGNFSTTYQLDTATGFVLQFMLLVDEHGNNIAAAKVGTRFGFPVRGGFLFYNGSTRTLRPYPVEDVQIKVSNGGSGSAPVSLGNGLYESSSVTVGSSAGINIVSFDALFHNKDYPGTPDEPPNPARGVHSIIGIFGVDPKITSVISAGAEPGVIPLNEDGLTLGPVDVLYSVMPQDYHSRSTELDVLKDGAWTAYSIGSSRVGDGRAPLPRDQAFELDRPYEAQLVLNRGSQIEVKSDTFQLPLRQKIFKDYSRALHVSQDVDVLNQRTCTIGSEFRFVLSQPATISLVATDVENTAATRTLISSRSYSAGEQSVAILPSDLTPGRYTFELTGVSGIDGHSETVRGSALSEYVLRDVLPVGHVMVKGVDVKDGHMVHGSTDLMVSGRGASLEFRRTYSSNGGHKPGPLGVRWAHNYDSKVIITPCGEAIVVGGEGSGMRFVEDGQGGLKPLKGYHGSLIANHTDRTFDFFSKDGTRYHYRLMGSRAQWDLEFIQDTNGNVTKLGYDPTSPRVAKLTTVEDSSRRSLRFTYTDRTFDVLGDVTPVITKVEGPDGMVVTFAYDDKGNLVKAARESIKSESYVYSPPSASLAAGQVMTSYVDPNGATTQYAYNTAEISVAPQGLTTFFVPNSYVTQVTDGEGAVTRFEFDRVAWQQTTVTDARTNPTVYRMNSYGSPLSIQDPIGTTLMTWAADDVVMTSKTDARGVRTDFTYDANGNVLTETVDGKTASYTYQPFTNPPIKNRVRTKTDRNGHTSTYSYDIRGNLISELNPEGGVTRHSYAGNGDRIETREPNGNVTRFTYDGNGNVETATNALGGVTRTAWNARSLPTRVTDPLGRVTGLSYDTLNRLDAKTDATGGVRRFTYDAVGNKLTEVDEEGRTTTWTHDRENRVKSIRDALTGTKNFSYNPVGNKISESDWKNIVTTFDYDTANRLIRRAEPLGKITNFTYDNVGNVLTETDALNRLTRYEYDALNRRTKRTNALIGVMEYGYDGVGNKILDRDELGRATTYSYDGLDRLTQKTQPLGRVTKFKYDANGNRTEEADPNGRVRRFVFDSLNRVIKRTDAEGNSTNLEYDAVGNLTLEINARLFQTRHDYDALNRRTKTTDPIGAELTYRYDKVGNRVSEKWPNGNNLIHVYDALNRLATTTDDLGQLAAYEYDANGNRTKETDANGNLTTKTYDELNRYIQTDMPEARTVKFAYDLVGNKILETDARNNTTQFFYDALNRLERIKDPFEKELSYTYDAVGNRLTETDKRLNITKFQYNDLDRLIKTTDALDQFMEFTYDLVGNKKTEIDKRRTLTSFTYDGENRLITTVKAGVTLQTLQYDEVGNKKFDTDANGNIVTYIYDGRNLLLTESHSLAAITNYQYDATGNRIQTRDPENRVMLYTYDLRRRMLTETDGENQTTTYTYDGNGNRKSVRKPKLNTWSYTYDGANRLRRIADPLGGETQYTYDGNNNRLTQVDANIRTTQYEYDALNRQTAMIYPDNARAEFRYDENGNRVGLTDLAGQVFEYVVDKLNRETNKNYPVPVVPTGDDIQSIVTLYDANGNVTRVTETYTGATGARVTNKTYDVFDRLADVTDAFGKVIKYQYDANGNRTILTDPDGKVTRYFFDALNRVSNVVNAGGTTVYNYDRSSLKTKVTYPNGTTAANTYDRARRTLTVTNKQGAATVSSYQYTYDANGNRVTQVETNGATAETTGYGYDNNDRLTEVAYPDKTTTYTYDAAYNRVTEKTVIKATSTIEVDKTYVYNNRSQLTNISDAANSANNVSYTFDANGNQTVKTKNGVITTFVYDIRDQLIAVSENSTTLGSFRYDYQGMRVSKDMGGQIVRYTYDDKSALLQTDNAGVTIAKYDYGPDRLLSLTHVTEGRQFYLFDALGSVSNLTTPAGAIQARYQYDAFGQFRAQAGSSFNRFTFTGHEKDLETGLFYFKARFYDPDTGRFLSQDPYHGDVDTPPSLHRYLYAYSNPTVYIDLEGYESVSTMIDNAAEGCGAWSCLGWAVLKATYIVSTAGFATVHDPVRDAYDEGKVSGTRYAVAGIGGGLVVAGINLGTARVGGTLIGTATTATGRIGVSAAVGGTSAAVSDATTQAAHIGAGIQEGYDVGRTATATLVGTAIGGGSAALVEGAVAAKQALAARAAARQSESALTMEGATNEVQRAPQGTQRASSKVASPEATPAETQAPKLVPEPSSARIETQASKSGLGKNLEAELTSFRESLGVPRTGRRGGTAGVAETDLPGLQDTVFKGASPKARVNVEPQQAGEIKSPSQIYRNHAEEDLANQLNTAIKEQRLTSADMVGKTIRMHIEQPVCTTCRAGFGDPTKPSGVLRQLSETYPNFTIEITARGTSKVLVIRGGQYVK